MHFSLSQTSHSIMNSRNNGVTLWENRSMVHEKYFRVGLTQSNLPSEKLKTKSPVSCFQPLYSSRHPFFPALSTTSEPGPFIPPQEPHSGLLSFLCFTTKLFQEKCIKQTQWLSEYAPTTYMGHTFQIQAHPILTKPSRPSSIISVGKVYICFSGVVIWCCCSRPAFLLPWEY